MPLLTRSADAFQRALEGSVKDASQHSDLLRVSGRLNQLATGPGPDPRFVAALRDRLLEEARTLPAPSPAAARTVAARRADARPTPVVVVVGGGLPRALAGLLASILLVGGVLGVVSRRTVPGDELYPVKGWLDSVAVQLAGNDFDRGQTYLAQAQEHISDARDLVDSQHSTPSTADVNEALREAIDSVQHGRLALDRAYAATSSPQALIAMRDFTARAMPQVEALQTQAPAGSLPLVGQLEALLVDSQQATARRMAACGGPCAPPGSAAAVPGALPSASATSTHPSPAHGPVGPGSGVVVPTTALPVQPSAGGPVAGVAGAPSGVSGPVATLSTGGVAVHLPSASVPAPGSTTVLKAPLPSVSLGTTGVQATVPSATLGTATVPGVVITIP